MSLLKETRFFLEYLALRAGLLLVPAMPRRAIRLVSAAAGGAAYFCSRKLRRIAIANLQIAFGAKIPERELRRIARRSFRSAALVMTDLLWFSRHTKSKMARFVEMDAETKSRLASSHVIGVTAHFGNWELISTATAELGMQHAAVFADLKNRYVTPFLYRLRNTDGVAIIRKQGAIGKLLRTLRRGKSIALLLDQNTLPAEGGIFVDFFGLPAPISGAAGLLSERTGVPVIVIFSMLRPDGTYRLYSLPVLNPSDFIRRGDTGEHPAKGAAPAITQSIVHAFEREITKHPEQWLWMYKRWKYVAPGAPRDAYPFYSRQP